MAAPFVGENTLSYVARGSGIISLALFTMTFALGLLTAGRVSSPSWPRFVTETLHRNLSLTAVTFIVVHVVTIVLDANMGVGPLEVLVPFIGTYSPLFLSLGTIALDILLTLAITGLLRTRLPYRVWRLIHWMAYAAWPVAVVHGIFIGSEQSWVLITAGASLVLVLACGSIRVMSVRRRSL
ncbi:ferric reductase-like transmembrane domain-containing protein [Kibdelosporangium lantanae]|uniref:Ferric reductase-like transmembrane domain-containing protein n=1 Tax=Kibdelosporangium lantanae TaxID=1497396 RepID=A0ABW3MJC5_9PSEU